MTVSTKDKIFSDLGNLAERVNADRNAGRTIVLANGVFDLIHVGHIRYLQGAKECGDILVVAINDDDSTRRHKGEGRPFVPGNERAEVLAGFSCVDYVTMFTGDRVTDVIEAIRPNIHAKGTDYTPGQIPEAADTERVGGKIAIVGDPKDHSTTDLMERVANWIQEVGR